MSTYNTNQLAPSLEFPEVGRVQVDVQLAQNARREGPRQAQEGLGNERDIRSAFGQGAVFSRNGSSHANYDAIIAGQAEGRERLGMGREVPSWNAVGQPERDNFLGGLVDVQPVNPVPMPWQKRPGSNPHPLAPTGQAFDHGERPSTAYGKTYAPPGGGRGRRNQADCTDV